VERWGTPNIEVPREVGGSDQSGREKVGAHGGGGSAESDARRNFFSGGEEIGNTEKEVINLGAGFGAVLSLVIPRLGRKPT
jgi:hypothetical protein